MFQLPLCPLPNAVTALARRAGSALVPYGQRLVESAATSMGGGLQRISNEPARRDAPLQPYVEQPDVESEIDWSQVLLMSAGVMAAGVAFWRVGEWLRQPGGFVAEAPPEEVPVSAFRRRAADADRDADVIEALRRRQAEQPVLPEQLQELWRESLGNMFVAGTLRGYRDGIDGRPANSAPERASADIGTTHAAAATLLLQGHWVAGYQQGYESAQRYR